MASGQRLDKFPDPSRGDYIASAQAYFSTAFPFVQQYTHTGSADNIANAPLEVLGRLHYTLQVEGVPTPAAFTVLLEGSVSGGAYETILTTSAVGITATASTFSKLYKYARVTVSGVAANEGVMVSLAVA